MALDLAAEAARKRQARDMRLAETDRYMLADHPSTNAQREDMRTYREALRNWPEGDDFARANALPPAPPWTGLEDVAFDVEDGTTSPVPSAPPVPPVLSEDAQTSPL